MRHRKQRSRLSMMGSRRKATIKNMVGSLLTYQRIEMIHGRAKVVRRHAEKLITLAKQNTVASRRLAYEQLLDRDLVGLLYNEIVPLFKDRTSGFTRIIPIGFRRGDGAAMAILELTEKSIKEKPVKKGKGKAEEGAKAETKKAKAHDAEVSHKKANDDKSDVEKEEAKLKHVSKSKPTLDDEKRAERARSEEKKMGTQKGFMKNVRGLFRKRGDK